MVAQWHVDAAYACHPDFKLHSGGIMFLHEARGGIAYRSTKQHISARFSTEMELVACDDFLSKILWCRCFMESQDVVLHDNVLFQDNFSSIFLAKNGRSSLGKCSQAMHAHYFAIKDHVDRGEIWVCHVRTNEMVGDYFLKPIFNFCHKIICLVGPIAVSIF